MNAFNEEKNIIKLNNDTIRKALKLFDENENEAIKLYGHISDWDTSEVTDMSRLFWGNANFNEDIGSWDVSNVITMEYMFSGADEFNKYIGSWNVSNVTNMEGIFRFATSFNQSLDSWDVSSVTNMKRMFLEAYRFNNDGSNKINLWDVSSVTNMSGMFMGALDFNQPLHSWDVSSVKDMHRMFCDAQTFDQDIGCWDVSKVTDMTFMFECAFSFNNGGNSSIEKWNVTSIIDMEHIFVSAFSFNQNIGRWPIKLDCIYSIGDMFQWSPVTKEIFEGKLYGIKIAEHFGLDNPNEFMVWEPYTRWERRKNAVMFFSSISKMDIKQSVNENIEDIKSNITLNYLHLIDNDIYKEIVYFL